MDEIIRQVQNDDDEWLNSDDDDYFGDEGTTEAITSGNDLDPLEQVQIDDDESTPDTDQETRASHHEILPPSASVVEPQRNALTNASFQPAEFKEAVGPVKPLGSEATPLLYFQQIFGEDTFDYIAQQTNLYAQQNPPGESYKWTPTCAEEIKVVIGMLLTMGIHRLPEVSDYWSKNPLLGVPSISQCMPILRFKSLLRCLHLNDNTKAARRGEDGYDKLHKIRPLLETVRHNSLSMYRPHQQNSIDEAMVLFKGRIGFKQYMPNKPVKRGYKVWMRADATNGYCCDFDIYTGALDGSVEHGLGAAVVKRMVQPLYGKGYHVFYDNFFSSVQLAQDLLQDKVYTIGTTRINRKNWPNCLKAIKEL